MRGFQIAAFVFIGIMLVVSARNLLRVHARPLTAGFWFVLWLAAAIAILNPNATTALAKSVGIQRGADLVVYCTVLGFFVAFFLVYLKIRQLTHDVTVLTRELALRDARSSMDSRNSRTSALLAIPNAPGDMEATDPRRSG
jgi:hypothetical protein